LWQVRRKRLAEDREGERVTVGEGHCERLRALRRPSAVCMIVYA